MMNANGQVFDPPKRLLIVMPTWVGDVVMATPALRALRNRWPESKITLLLPRNAAPLLEGTTFADEVRAFDARRIGPMVRAARQGEHDIAAILPGSFRWAMATFLARIPRRVGYERDKRGWLLTDRLLPLKNQDGFVPVPTIDYYLGIARYMGSTDVSREMELPLNDSDRANARAVLEKVALDPDAQRPGSQNQQPWILMNPGAQKPEKRWPVERWAELADRLIEAVGARVLFTGSPDERDVLNAVQRNMQHLPYDLVRAGITLGGLKDIARRCDVMVTNDTGPRHIAIAMGTPTLSLFGPTLPEWTTTFAEHDTELVARHFNPIGLMSSIPVAAIFEAALQRCDGRCLSDPSVLRN